jgi:poly(3-hydroxybutyrate) depolymerase
MEYGIKYFISAVSCFSLFSFGNSEESNPVIIKIEIGGKQREYILYLPANLPANSPLVYVIHGYTENAQNMMNTTAFNESREVWDFFKKILR